MSFQKKLFLIVSLLYILYTIFPLFGDLFSIPVWLPSLGAFLVMFLLFPSAFANKVFVWFSIYALVLIVYLFLGRPLTIGIGSVVDSKKIFIEFAYILPSISILSILLFLNDMTVTKLLIKWSMIMLFVSFVVAVPLMFQYNSLRSALDIEEDIGIPGLPGYSLMHAYTLFLPVLCYATKVFKGRQKAWSLVGLLVLCFVIYDTFVTASLLVMICLLLFTIFYKKTSTSLFWIFFGAAAILLYLFYLSGAFIYVIDWMLPYFRGTPVAGKLLDMRSSLYLGELTGGNLVTRQELHSISWNSFFQNPLFGTSVVGRHSVLVDRLGGMGLVCFVPFIMIVLTSYRKIFRLYQSKIARVFVLMGFFAGLMYMYEKGLWGCESWLMYLVLMPFGVRVFEAKNNG